jgi:hypothetical protein
VQLLGAFANPCLQLYRHFAQLFFSLLALADVGMRYNDAVSERGDNHAEPALFLRRMAGVFQAETGQAAGQHRLDAVEGALGAVRWRTGACLADGQVIGADLHMRYRLAGFNAVFRSKSLPGLVDGDDDSLAVEHGNFSA